MLDLLGNRYERLVVIHEVQQRDYRCGQKHRRWLCRCDCGTLVTILQASLRIGDTSSCGCLNIQRTKEANRKHGHTIGKRSREYRAWVSMKSRCENECNSGYQNYGGRGISVCLRWRKSFGMFLQDMGEAPECTSLDRIDNDGSYSRENCRWATRKEQCRNKRSNFILAFRGQRLCLAEWTERCGISSSTLWHRIQRGWSTERALTESVHIKFRSNQQNESSR